MFFSINEKTGGLKRCISSFESAIISIWSDVGLLTEILYNNSKNYKVVQRINVYTYMYM